MAALTLILPVVPASAHVDTEYGQDIFKETGEVLWNMRAVMILGRTGVRTMTCFPSKSKSYCYNKYPIELLYAA